MADELEDNFVLDDDLSVAGSDSGEAVDIEEVAVAEDGSVVRKTEGEEIEAALSKENKKRKRKEKEKARKQKRAALAAEHLEGTGSVAAQPIEMQVDYLSSRQRKTFSKLSELELEELRITERMMVETTAFESPRTEDFLGTFIQKFCPSTVKALLDPKSSSNSKPGHPSVLVLTGNALRAAKLSRSLKALNPTPSSTSQKPPKKRVKGDDGSSSITTTSKGDTEPTFTVAKLFARHFKLKEHISWLKDHVTPVAVGTPQRVGALIDSGSLSLQATDFVVIDQTWVDAKQRNIFDTPETRDELVKLLASEGFREAVTRSENGTKLILF
ncbi:hypothetical protein IE53DRAFT_387111 [Violaceomyces palustris]|uniref:Uncharacterized protein n=1 Tax=Violaceomyces palustris TaxID=1673888 RepID=A0ACD0NXT3_9BASI|nr:hypothetical protein IE53DRAFT_387111 [Violaceomyces palustris]